MSKFDLGTNYFDPYSDPFAERRPASHGTESHQPDSHAPIAHDDLRAMVKEVVAEVIGPEIAALRRHLEDVIGEMGKYLEEKYDLRFRHIEDEMANLRRSHPMAKPEPDHGIPPLAKINRIYAQYFDNRARNAAIRATGKKATYPNYQIKLQVWTCPPEMIDSYPEGNCRDFFMTLQERDSKAARRMFADKLDYLGDAAKFVGCLHSPTKYDQGAALTSSWRLTLALLGEPVYFPDATTAPSDAQRFAAPYRWDWRREPAQTPSQPAQQGF